MFEITDQLVEDVWNNEQSGELSRGEIRRVLEAFLRHATAEPITPPVPRAMITSLDEALTAAEERVKKFTEDMIELAALTTGMSSHKREAYRAGVAALMMQEAGRE